MCNRLEEKSFADMADENFWMEYQKFGGGDILPISLAYEHDFDEYGLYDRETCERLGLTDRDKIVAEAEKFIYSTIF